MIVDLMRTECEELPDATLLHAYLPEGVSG
jgi:hypothetical protein